MIRQFSQSSCFAVALCFSAATLSFGATIDALWTFEEGAGSTTADSSGNGHDLNFVGPAAQQPTWTVNTAPVPTGSTAAIQFNNPLAGGTGYLTATVDNYKGVTGINSRALASWVQMDNVAPNDQTIASWGTNATGQKWTYRINDNATNGLTGTIRTEVNGGYIIGSRDIQDGQYHHVVTSLESDGTPNANEIRMYVDGRREIISGVQAQAINTANGVDVRLGFDFTNEPFRGNMDETAIYSTHLTAREARILATGSDLPIATINYDAATAPTGVDTQNVFDFQTAPDQFDLASVPAVMTQGSRSYWQYDGNTTSTMFNGAVNFQDVPGDATDDSASFLMTFRRQDTAANQVLFETGGDTDGASLSLSGDNLQFLVSDSGTAASLSYDLSSISVDDFIQVLGVVDLDSDEVRLYVNGQDAGTTPYNAADWGGTDPGALGNFINQIGGNSGGTVIDPTLYGGFIGDIADFSYFSDALDLIDAQNLFAASQVPEPGSLAVWALLGTVGAFVIRRRKQRQQCKC